MGWRILYVEECEYLNLYLDNLKIVNQTGELLIPINDIHTLIVDNYKTVLSTQLINKLTSNHVNIVLCGLDHLPASCVLPINGNYKAVERLMNQLAWSSQMKGSMRQSIVKAKILNQREILLLCDKDADHCKRMYDYASTVEYNDKMNNEGVAARVYFETLFGYDFRRENECVINSALNYGYAILRSQISSSLIAKGLNTSLGLFHHSKLNSFNLSDDVIEVFRPIIDYYVYLNFLNETFFKREHRLALVRLTSCKVKYHKEEHTLLHAINLYIDNIIQCMDEEDYNLYVAPEMIIQYDS